MKINNLTLKHIPLRLRQLPDAPKALYTSCEPGQLKKLLRRPSVAIVGSRNVSPYGKQVTADLAGKLAGQGIVVISGLALGVDGIAHQAALNANGLTIAVLPSPLERIYPASHRPLARDIVYQGGALVSEYTASDEAYRWNFVARNRIVAGLADALLITEAADKSGTLHTAGFALDQGKPVLAVPGNITSPTSAGTNSLIKSGATPVTDVNDILAVLGLQPHNPQLVRGANSAEQAIIDMLLEGLTDAEELQQRSGLEIGAFSQAMTMLEISGKIRSLGANHWALC